MLSRHKPCGLDSGLSDTPCMHDTYMRTCRLDMGGRSPWAWYWSTWHGCQTSLRLIWVAEALRLDMNEYPDYQVLLKLHIILCHAIVKPWSHCKALHGNHFFPFGKLCIFQNLVIFNPFSLAKLLKLNTTQCCISKNNVWTWNQTIVYTQFKAT